ncbi:MAG: hypothetical protein ABI380_16100 [Edaphobacter sp.]
MSKVEANQAATRYMQEQAEIMKKYGDAPKLSGPDYQAAVAATTRTFQRMGTKLK